MAAVDFSKELGNPPSPSVGRSWALLMELRQAKPHRSRASQSKEAPDAYMYAMLCVHRE